MGKETARVEPFEALLRSVAGRGASAREKSTGGGKAMNVTLRRIKSLFSSSQGAAATEYAFMLALIAVVCIAAISGLGGSAANAYATLDSGLTSVVGS
jgi:Flp pilus assembly pilin Flp